MTIEGFVVNGGVIRGAHFSTGKTLYARCGGLRDNYVRGNGSSAIGFRAVNGVDRGGGYNGYGRHDKCSYRDGAGRITRVLSSLGFRLNGVYRGGQVNSDSANKQCVSYRSNYPVLSYVNRNLGFRLCKLFHVEQW